MAEQNKVTTVPATNQLPQLLIDNMAVSYIGKLMSETEMKTFSINTIIKVLLILSIDEIRKGVTGAITLGKDNIPTIFKYLWGKAFILGLFTNKIKMPFRKKVVLEPVIENKIVGSYYNFEWKNCHIYSKMIYNQITNNKNCKFNKFYGKVINTIEHGKNLYSIDYRDVKIPIDNDNDKSLEIDLITFKSDMTFEMSNRKVSMCDYLVDTEFTKLLRKCTNCLVKKYELGDDDYRYGGNYIKRIMGYKENIGHKNTTKSELIANSPKTLIEETATKYIMLLYPDFDVRKIYIELQIILYHVHCCFPDFNQHKLSITGSTYGDQLLNSLKQLQFKEINFYEILKDNISSGDNAKGNNIYSSMCNLEILRDKNNKRFIDNDNNNNQDVKKDMNIRITSKNIYSDEELVNSFIKFLESNSDGKMIKAKEVHIFELKLKINKKVSKEDNPEYASWKELKDEIMSKNKESNPFSIPRPPPQFIEKVVLEKEIIKTDINETFKSMDTLYLPNNVSTNLLKILDNFMNKKTGLFTRLGIPHKLGICLYGKPGTGKSTTIKVIGSYLGKDIYYVNMNGITKNSELKLMFDFVIRKQCEGGIIVFEDFDCSCNIVKPREKTSINNLSDTSITNLKDTSITHLTDIFDTDELSLSYLLNLLDGTLCAKNTIFIITTNHIDHLDPALIRPGRCDIKIELKDCDRYQIKRIWQSVMEYNLDEEILNSVPEYKFTPAELIFHLLEYVYQVDISPQEILNDLYKKINLSI